MPIKGDEERDVLKMETGAQGTTKFGSIDYGNLRNVGHSGIHYLDRGN